LPNEGLINLHSLPRGRSADGWHLGVVCLAVVLNGLVVDVGLESLVEVVRADACDNNGKNEQKNGEHSKGGQRLARRLVVLLAVQVGNVHADELEQEVGHGNEVDDNNGNHAGNRLATDPPGGEEEEEKGDDQGDGGQSELDRLCVLDDDEKLYCKRKEKEEVKLQERNVNLKKSVVYVRGDAGDKPGMSDNASSGASQR